MYVRGMGQACDPGYQPSADGTVCESTQTFSLGQTCMASSFPWIGSITQGAVCTPVSPLIGYAAIGILALVLLKGSR